MKKHSKAKLKGTVLFTVISVMSLLIIFLTSTLVLATSASNRAHKNYSSSQTEYTARTAIDSVLNAIKVDNTFADAVCNVSSTNSSLSVPVEFQSDNLRSMGKIDDVMIEYVGAKDYFNPDSNKWEQKDLLKLTASVTLAGQTSTTSAYLVKDPPKPDGGGGGGAGFVTTGGATMKCQTDLYGGAYINIPSLAKAENYNYLSPTKDYLSTYELTFHNSPLIEADFVLNGSLNTKNSLKGFIIPCEGKGITIWGNLDFCDMSNNLISLSNCNVSGKYNFNKIPYLYVDNTIKGQKINIGNSSNVLNIFCGNIEYDSGQPFNAYSDIYCMDSGRTSKLKNANPNNSTLYKWTSSVINKTSGQDGVYNTGNIFSKGNLDLKNMTIEGNVRAEGDVTISGTVSITGDLVVGGTLTVNPGDNLNVSGTVYANNVLGYGTPAGLRAGYTEVDNFLHPEEYVIDDPGYEKVNNNYYEYTLYEATEKNPVTWQWIGAYGEDIGWEQKVYYDVNGDWKSVGAMWTCLSKDDGSGNTIYYYYVECDKYGNQKEQINFGIPTGKLAITNQEFYVVKSTDPDQMPVSPMAVGHYEPAYWTIADINGNDTGDVTSDAKSYYRVADGQSVSRIEALEISGVLPLSSYGQDIYPEYAEKDVILGLRQLNDYSSGKPLDIKETQVVNTMEDVLNNVVNPYKYSGIPIAFQSQVESIRNNPNSPDMIKDCKKLFMDSDISKYSEFGTKIAVINKTCIINVSKLANGDANALVINPDGKKICVVIDNLTLDSGIPVIVDDSKPGSEVYLFINDGGTLTLNDGTIIAKSYYDLSKYKKKLDIKSSSSKIQVLEPDGSVSSEVDPPKIYIYGGTNSTLDMQNLKVLTGYVMSPDINVKLESTAGNYFKDNDITYDGCTISNNKLIIGCLNSKTTDVPNMISTLYIPDSSSGDQIDTPDKTHWFKILYYDEY